MKKILTFDMQLLNEETYSRKHIDKKIKEEILDKSSDKIEQGVKLLDDWLDQEYYESKQERLNQLKNMDLELLVTQILIGIAYYQTPELFTGVTAQLASRLKFSDKKDAIWTVAEIVSVLCETDAFDIGKESKYAPLKIVSRISLSEELIRYINNSQYLPPMVHIPLELRSNYDSGYLTHNDSLILGKGNHHQGDICLDVLNSKNKIALKLDAEYLCQVEECPNSEFKTSKQIEQWNVFKKQSYKFYSLMVSQGNRFYLTHKVDTRGRIYAQGYHISTIGTSFKKAIIELADEEYVDVPEQYRK